MSAAARCSSIQTAGPSSERKARPGNRQVHWNSSAWRHIAARQLPKKDSSCTRLCALPLAAPIAIAAVLAPVAASRPGRARGLAQVAGASARGHDDDRRIQPRPTAAAAASGTLTIRAAGQDPLRLWAQRQHADRRRRARADLRRLRRSASVQRWPIDDSPLSVLLDPGQDLAPYARA